MTDIPPAEAVEQAAAAALEGRLAVYPTDTVYAISTRPDDAGATARLFEAKARSRDLELPVLVPSSSVAREIAAFDESGRGARPALRSGPLTTPCHGRTEPFVGSRRRSRDDRGPGAEPSPGLRTARAHGAARDVEREPQRRAHPGARDEIEAMFGERVEVYLCEEAARRSWRRRSGPRAR